MKIHSVQHIQSYPVFFCGKKVSASIFNAPISNDVFIKSNSEIEILKNSIYDTTLSQLELVTESEVQKIADNIAAKTGLGIKSIYRILGKITAFSSYKSLDKIKNGLKEYGNPNVSNIIMQKEDGSRFICLSDALSYIMEKNFSSDISKNSQKCYILDSLLADYLENLSENDRKDFIAQNLSKHKLIYIEDFEDSYNFLNQSNNIEDFAEYYINKEHDNTPERYKKMGIDFMTIKNTVPENVTSGYIANNLNPIYPSKEELLKVLSSIASKKGNDNEREKYILSFLQKMLFLISPAKYSKYMKKIEQKIQIFVQKHNKDPKNIYYIIPDIRKSFITTNYQYKNANNVPDKNYLFPSYNQWYEKQYNIDELPDDSTIVILDDCIITGLSLANEVFNYQKLFYDVKSSKKDISIILSSAVATEPGLYNLKNMIKQYRRDKKDDVICGAILPEWKTNHPILDEKYLSMETPNRYITAMQLPYMAPDSNLDIVRPLIQKFLYSKNAQKSNYPHFHSIFFE